MAEAHTVKAHYVSWREGPKAHIKKFWWAFTSLSLSSFSFFSNRKQSKKALRKIEQFSSFSTSKLASLWLSSSDLQFLRPCLTLSWRRTTTAMTKVLFFFHSPSNFHLQFFSSHFIFTYFLTLLLSHCWISLLDARSMFLHPFASIVCVMFFNWKLISLWVLFDPIWFRVF